MLRQMSAMCRCRITNFNEAQPFLSLRVGRMTAGRSRIDLKEEQVAQISGAAVLRIERNSRRPGASK